MIANDKGGVLNKELGRTTIIRVEDEFGEGPYRDPDSEAYDIIGDHKHNDGRHPTPAYDEGIKRTIRYNEICGFLNMEQLKNWFSDKELKDLQYIGYYVKIVEVKEITGIGNCQVLAIPRRGKRICEYVRVESI